jgi:hypothetical protein
MATDVNQDVITYVWSANNGDIAGSDDHAVWTAPNVEGIATIQLMISDGRGGAATATIQLLVLDPDLHLDGELIAWYPFDGNAQDISGNQLHGQVFGPKLTDDAQGNPISAYFFDGVNDHILVTNELILNFSDGITVSLFAQPQTIGDKERFLISHGSWQNRWKLSITPDRKVRWTLKNENGQVRDLDSETILDENIFYHIAATYNGRFMMLYINGMLESFTPFNGPIHSSPVDLEIGQIVPDDQMYSFRGILDGIKIHDYALRPDSVAAESGIVMTSVSDPLASDHFLFNLFPNPSKEEITLQVTSTEKKQSFSGFTLTISDLHGHRIWQDVYGDMPIKHIDLSGFMPGLYLLRLMDRKQVWIRKFVVEK